MLAVKESLKSTVTFENAMKYLMIYGTTNHSMQILSFLFIAFEAQGGELLVFTAVPLLSLIGDIAVIILEVMQIEFLIENPWIHKILMMVIFFTQMLLDALVTAIFFFVRIALCSRSCPSYEPVLEVLNGYFATGIIQDIL